MTSFAGRTNEKIGFRATASSERGSNYTVDNPFNVFIPKAMELVVSGQRYVKPVTFGFKLKYRISFEHGELIYEVETPAQIKYITGNSRDLRTAKIIRPPNPT